MAPWWPRGHRPRPGCVGCGRSTRRAWAASSHEPDLEYALALLILAALVAVVVLSPLRGPGHIEIRDESRIQELQAAKEAKYREIRDAELDHQMGKLSRDDWRAVDRDLRGEAIVILRELDRIEGRAPDVGMDR